jgi:hypothetical protein
VLGRICTPGSPALGPCEQFARGWPPSSAIGERAQETDIARRKRIRLPQFTHHDVLRRPFANAGQRTKSRHTLSQASSATKDLWIRDNSRRQGRQCRGTHPRYPDRGQIRRR